MPRKKRALFLDRDGVIIEDKYYPHKIEDITIIEEIIPHLIWAQEKNLLIIIVTNQSGIARGIFTVEEYELFQNALNAMLRERGVFVDAVYYCPYLKGGSVPSYNRESEDRKPNPGMFLKAQKDFSLSLEDSFMIGDKISDIIDYPGLHCFIMESAYTKDCREKTYVGFDPIFQEIERAL